jgi:Asp-tRNA(Asn)/Glu-tRNA(Gln) amidotransferase B subunit
MPSESGLPAREAAERISAWLSSDVKRIMNRDGIGFDGIATMKLTPARLAQLVLLIASGFISSKIAKQTLEAVFAEDADPADIVARPWLGADRRSRRRRRGGGRGRAKESRTVSEIARGDERARSLVAYLTGKVIAATGGRPIRSWRGRLVEERARALMEEGRNA